MQDNAILSFSGAQSGCHHCQFHKHCQPKEGSQHDRQLFGRLTIRHHKFERGDHLFLANDAFKNVFAIRSGSVKTYTYAQEGEEQVTGYHLSGKLLGLDAIATGYHDQSAVALETCSICEIPLGRLGHIGRDTPQLQDILLQAMSNEIRDDHYQLALLSRMPAASRLAGFLICLSWHFRQRGYSRSNFNLSLSRHDIASLLGLAVETVSRLFTQFQDEGLLIVDRKHIILNDMEGLRKLAPDQMEQTQNPRNLHQPVDLLYHD